MVGVMDRGRQMDIIKGLVFIRDSSISNVFAKDNMPHNTIKSAQGSDPSTQLIPTSRTETSGADNLFALKSFTNLRVLSSIYCMCICVRVCMGAFISVI